MARFDGILVEDQQIGGRFGGIPVGDEEPKAQSGVLDTIKQGILGSWDSFAQGANELNAGVGTFMQAPEANMLSGVLSANALASRKIRDWTGIDAGTDAAQETARSASVFAAEKRAENLRAGGALAIVGKAGETSGRSGSAYYQQQKDADAPEMVRQENAISDADGFWGTVKASAENPMGLTGTLARSLPDMAVGAGVAMKSARVAGALAEKSAIAAGAAPEVARAAGVAAAEKAASFSGIISEAASSGLHGREGSYQHVQNIPEQALAEIPRYKALLEQTGDKAKARDILANEIADQVPLLTSAGTAAGTIATNKMFGGDATAKTLAGGERMTAKDLGKRVAQDTVEEGIQGVPEDYVQHSALVQADPSHKFDLGSTLAQNMVAGLAMGAGGHGAGYVGENASRLRGQGNESSGAEPAPVGATPADSILGSLAPVTDAEKALYTPKNLTALDRVSEIDARLAAGEQITGGEAEALADERATITAEWPQSVAGASTSFSTEAGARLDANYALMDAGDLTTSHDENLRSSPNYPAELQPRERERAASEMQVSGIVQKLDPARLGLSAYAATGAPIVGADGLVESGNARTIALKRVYQANGQKAADYRQFIKDNAAQFGIAPESVDAMAKPVLVRVRSTPVNRAEFARQANASTVAQMSSSETAKSDADRMDVLDDLLPDANGDFSTSRDFIRRFMGKLPVTEQAGMLDAGGQLSQSGYTRIRNAVLAKAYGNSPVLARMVESMDDNLRNVGKALVAAAPSVAKARQAVAEGALFDTDITPDLMAAVEELSRIKDSGQSIDEALAQSGMFGDHYSAETRELIQFLADNMRRPRAIAEFIQAYMGALTAAGNPNQGSIFGDAAAPSKADLINAAKGKDNGSIAENPVGRQPSGAEGAGAEVGQRSADAQGGSGSAQGDEAANQEVDQQWRMFDKDSGTLGIPRANMPQVAIRLRPAMLAFMESKGISYEREDIVADEIKPTQAEYSLVKAERARNIADDRSDKSAVLVSSDGYVLDGHHRWVAKAQEKQPVNVIRFDAPIDRLLDAVREFSGTTTSNESGELLAKRTQAVERFYDAAGDLAQVLSKHTRAAIIPEQTPNLMPTLVKLFDAAFDIVGTDAKRATAWVKERLKALPEFRTKWNKILPETYRKAALQAAEQFDPNKHAQGSIFQAASSAAPAQGDMFRGGTAEKPAVAMIDGRPYDMKRGRAPAEETASETSSPVRASAPVEELGAAMEPTWDSFSAFWNGLLDGKGTIADVRDAFGTMLDRAEEMKASIGKLKNDQLKRMIGGWARPDDKKAELVKKVYEATIDRFTLNNSAPSKSWTYGEKMEVVEKRYQDQLRAIVDGLTDADLAAFRADVEKSTKERKEALDQKKAAVADPKRLADFDLYAIYNRNTGKTSQEARAALTVEQRATWDRLAAEKSRSERQNSLAERKSEVSVAAQTADGQIVETKHTKTGEGLFVVKAAERVERDVYNLWNSTAKRMGGWYSSFRGNGAVPGFQFKTRENADAFLKFLGGDKGQAQEVVKEHRDAYADDRSQSAVERLTEMADRIEEAADQEMGRERKTNTNKRASQAASADAAARRAQAMAKTMRNIAASIDSGTAKFLDRVRQKVQIEMLQDFANTAKDVELRAKYPSYADQEKHKGEPATSETAEHATWPTYTAFRSDLASLGRQLLGTDGTKKLGQRLLKVADDVTAAYKKFAEANLFKVSTFKTADGKPAVFRTEDAAEQAIARSGYVGKATTISFKRGEHLVIMGPAMARENNLWQGDDDKRITLSDEFGAELIAALGRVNRNREKVAVPWQFQSTYDRRKRLSQMSIETPAEFRSVLREFINLRESPKEADKIKELERAMVGRRNDGLDFFPTPEGVAQEMIDAAEIEPGMSVLEPSAGMGHIAEMIRGAGVDPDVVEMANDRKELLEAKGFRVVGRDFMDMNPRSFTFGDTFKMEDGTEGVMRGLGGMGSNRVRLVVDGDERTAIYVDRDELTGVKKSGANSGYDRIIMNPPFSDRRDALHVQHAYSLLKPGGRLVAIMGEGVFNGQDKKAQAFREWLEEVGGSEEKLPEGSFLDPSLPVNTGVNARMVVIEKAGIESSSAPMLSTAETESRDSDGGLSRGGGGSMAMRDLKAVRDRVSAGMKNMPPVHVLEEPGQAPKTLRDHIEKVGAWNDVEGATYEGEIYLFASNMANEERAEFVLAQHEITHYGLRGKLGMGLDAALQNVWMNNSSVRKAASVLRSENRLSSNLEAVEEVLADMPSAELVALKGWRKMTANVRDWFAEHGFARIAEKLDRWIKSNMSDQAKADLYAADLVRAARGWVRSGNGHGKYSTGAPKLSRAASGEDAAPAQTAEQRADAIIAQSAATIQPIDKLVKGLTQIARIDQGTTWVYNKVGSLLDRWAPEQIKAGFVADYGVPEAVIDRRVAMQGSMKTQLRGAGDLIDKLSMLTRAESRVAYEWMNNADPQAAAFFESQLPAESVKVMSDVKALVDKLSQEAVKLGQLDPEAFKSNRFEYLRRSYVKHTTELTKGESNSRQRSIAVLGDQYKGRGMTDSAPMAKIKNVAPEWWGRKLQQGKADKDLKGEKFIRLERRAPNGQGTLPLVTIQGPGNTNPLQKGRLLEVNYWPAGEPIPAKYSAWDQAGTWDVRDTKGGSLIMWRDFSKEERVAMGEIDEARYAIAKTLHGMIHDVETGRYLEWLAQRYAVKNAGQVPGRLVEASERMRDTFARGEWVQVPDSKIIGTNVKKYGLLAGRYLPGPIWNDVRQMSGPRIGSDLWRSILGAWKTSKTALSPAVHTNNVMANFVMADWHDVTSGHVLKALRLILAAHDRDGTGFLGRAGNLAATAGSGDREAAKVILDRFSDSGGNIGTWATAELQKEQLAPLLDALEKELGVAGQSPAAQVGAMVALQKMLQLKLPSAWDAFKPTKPGRFVTNEARNMLALYEAEDQFFRLAAWLKAKEDGATDMAAGKVARKSFLDYNINAPWVQIMRSTALPFVSFAYRAVPMLLETAATKPWKLMKLGLLAGALNAVGYLFSGGDEDDERKLLPEEKAGKIFGYHGDLLGMLDKKINVGLGPKLVRMPWNDSNSDPVFLDIRRFIPVGDVFDLAAGHSAIPLPPSMVPGGPLAVLAEIVLNRSQFTGKPVSLETDTGAEQAGKVFDHFSKAFLPNLPLPNPVGYLAESVTGVKNVGQTYSWTGISNAGKGKTDSFGREQSVAQAMTSSFGVKLGSYPKNVLRQNAEMDLKFKEMEIKKNISSLQRELQKKGISREEFNARVRRQYDKEKELVEDFQKRMSGG